MHYQATFQFKTSRQAIENMTAVTRRLMNDDLIEFLKTNLPTKKKSSSKSFSLAVIDKKLGEK